ncbi:30S ribosomal protein S8 [Candidatus Roizmanbacteria bacterium RIFCSPHIGHO2_02_FULL_40_9]|uniref:Small ribosomal subunit protein uS8 n=1 Tax=Candidatus Roizmanbacteria bacterium RIFCSPHIGHO2_02_FULL_40_9 TaxID=1802042 RepID=A0A1F7HCL3_9BACT|nr:MAG: 30S ribosomal protein S8 [Candidatus Roizmanbacteria bacterium RIFCSPHIGHO2_02_FULL_40_9]
MSTVIDLLIRIKNGYLAQKESIIGIYSKLNVHILEILKNEKYIKEFSVQEDNGKSRIIIELLYQNKQPALRDVAIVSKPGRRAYFKSREMKSVRGGLGLAILSTAFGVMTDKQARQKKIGGEVLFRVW